MYHLLLACLAALVLGASACPFGWTQSGSSCYRISDQPATWDQAAQRCSMFSSCVSGFGGYLASITTDFENQQLMDILNFNGLARNATWLGLRTIQGPILWASGEQLNTRLSNPWHPGNPMRGWNMCTAAFNGRWMTSNCNMRLDYVCEMAGAPTPPAMLQEMNQLASP